MKNHNLYIHAPVKKPSVMLRKGKPVATSKAKRSDVPPMYRRNILADILKGILIVAFSASIINFVLFFATVL